MPLPVDGPVRSVRHESEKSATIVRHSQFVRIVPSEKIISHNGLIYEKACKTAIHPGSVSV
jgi:hypothetical protein